MTANTYDLGEEFVRLALAIDEHLPGYVDSYFGPAEWREGSRQAGKIPLQHLSKRVAELANGISQADGMDAQRRDFLARQVTAMQMSVHLLSGGKVSLAEEVHALYDVQPGWTPESEFEEAHRQLDDALPAGESLQERAQDWRQSLEIPIEKVRELLPLIASRLRGLTRSKFNLPDDESFVVEFVSDQPWGAYNWYLGGCRSRIELNTDLPSRINVLPDLIAHEGYPGHHTELSIKEETLIGQRRYHEHVLTLINSPSCVISEGIATSALEAVLTEGELEDWYREELLPLAGLTHIDPQMITKINHAGNKLGGLAGNAAFMLHDQGKSEEEISLYLQKYGLKTRKEAQQSIKFISNPLYRSYIFTYHVGYDLLNELFSHVDRDTYFKRLLQEPVTPHQVREWIKSH